MLASQEDLITTEKRAAWCFMEKQVNWRVLSELRSHRPDDGGGGGGEDGGKATRRGGGGRRLVSKWYSNGALFTPPVMTERRRRNDGSRRTKHMTPGRDELVSSGVAPHLLPLFNPPPPLAPRPPLPFTQETELPHCQHLTPYVFFCPQCLSQTKRKINNAFFPPFPL